MERRLRQYPALALAVVLLLMPGVPHAQETDAVPPPLDTLRYDHELQKVVVGLAGVRVSHPKRVSGSFGWMFTDKPSDYDCRSLCRFRGWYLQAEPGLSGAQVSAGYANVLGEKGNHRFFLDNIYLAYGVKGAVLRSWGDADLSPSGQTLVGIEGDFTVIRVNFSLGAFHSIGGDTPDNPWVISGGIGWGF